MNWAGDNKLLSTDGKQIPLTR